MTVFSDKSDYNKNIPTAETKWRSKMETVKIRRHEKKVYMSDFVRALCKQALAAFSGFFASTAAFEGLSPFGAALAAGIHPEYIPSAVLGAAAGAFYIYGVTVLTLRYVASAVIAGILSYMLKRSLKRKFHGYFSLIAGFFPLFVTGLVLSLSVTLSADEFILYGAEGIVGALAAWFFFKVVSINFRSRSMLRFSASETASVLIVFSILLMSLSSFDIFVFMPDVAVGAYVVLVAAFYGGDRFGAVFGITAGTVLGLSGNSGFLTGGISLGGLLCGFFGKFNRFAGSAVFLICVAVTVFAADDWMAALNILYNVLFAASVFIAMPGRAADFYKRIFAVPRDGVFMSGQRGVLKSRLRTAADGMSDVTASVKAVAGIYRRRALPREDRIYDNICRRVCQSCERFNQCCNRDYNETVGWFVRIADTLKRGAEPQQRELPAHFVSSCIHQNKVISELAYEVECYRTSMRECAKTGETVNIVADQFTSVARLLDGFSYSMEHGDEYDINRTGIVYDVLVNEIRKEPESCGVFKNENKRLFCEISLDQCSENDGKRIVAAVSRALGMQFEPSVLRKLSDGTVNITFCEKTRYAIESGSSQISSGGGKWCGDTFDSFYDGKGNFYMVLSDGMGTGQKAAADSVLCCSLASLLLRSGYPVDCILAMVNAAMLVRSGEESLATLDIAVINLYTGETEFFKAGASASVAMKKFKLLKIEKPSLPVGILGDVKFETVSLGVQDSDVIVLMSDGVTDDVLSVWREILRDSADYGGKELADRLTKTAFMNCGKENADDITVITATIRAKQ